MSGGRFAPTSRPRSALSKLLFVVPARTCAPPLPEGERVGVRGARTLDRPEPPHPGPLPQWGEGEKGGGLHKPAAAWIVYAMRMPAFLIGTERSRLPVAAKMALSTAG